MTCLVHQLKFHLYTQGSTIVVTSDYHTIFIAISILCIDPSLSRDTQLL